MSGTGRRGAHMRIIGGAWRSRRVECPRSTRTRPMPDRIREAVFGILGSRYGLPGTVPPFMVADLFAGSGGMGLEAVSRGACGCDFVERSRAALAVLRRNLRALEAEPNCRIIDADAWTVPLTTPRVDRPYGLIVVDPPYADARDTSRLGKVVRLLGDLYRCGWADDQTTIIVHHEARVAYQPADGHGWEVCDRRVYGKAAVTFVRSRRTCDADRGDAAAASESDPGHQ